MQSLMRVFLLGLAFTAACGDAVTIPASGTPTATPPVDAGAPLKLLGLGTDTTRYTAEVAVRGTTAYTTTWGTRRAVGNKVNIWDVTTTTPVLVDSLVISGASTLGDVAVSDDGTLLIVATERTGGSIAIFSLANPRRPQLITRFTNANTNPGVHTAEIGRVNGKLHAFLSTDVLGTTPSRIVIVDLSVPTAPREVFTKVVGSPFVHDTYVRDGLLFLGLWNNGVEIWDIGGGGKGGTPENPVVLSNTPTTSRYSHNIWWYHDAAGGKKYAFVGQEGPTSFGSSSSGDIIVLDVSNMAAPKEVAYYHVDGAGSHNFSVDEKNGVLYAAYYNGGVRAIDVRGDLGTCAGNQQNVTAGVTRCDLRLMGREIAAGLVELNRQIFVWGVQYDAGRVYASDMFSGLFVLNAAR